VLRTAVIASTAAGWGGIGEVEACVTSDHDLPRIGGAPRRSGRQPDGSCP